MTAKAIPEAPKILMRTYYDGLQPAISDDTATVIDLKNDPSLTKQEFNDECDINQIMARFEKTGEITHFAALTPRYGDFTVVTDYQTALQLVSDAEDAFASLPAKIRDRFNNDPEAFLAFVSDPANEKEMRELGVLENPVHQNPVPASEPDPKPPGEPSNGPQAAS